MKEQLQLLIDRFIPNKRKQDFAAFAHEFGFSFQSRAGIERQAYGVKGFEIIKSNYWNEFVGIVTKTTEDNIQIRMYDYSRTTNHGQHVTTIVEIYYKDLNLNKFLITPLSKISKLKSLIIDPDNNFFDNYQIKSTNVETIIDELGDNCLNFINKFKNLYIEGNGDYLLLYHRHKKLKIHELPLYYEHGIQLLESIFTEGEQQEFV